MYFKQQGICPINRHAPVWWYRRVVSRGTTLSYLPPNLTTTPLSVGVPEGTPEPIASAFPGRLVFKGATIASVAVGTRRDAIEVMDFAARGENHALSPD